MSRNLTLYHINPLDFPSDPINMNLGDLTGALFYDFFEIFQTFPCSSDKPLPPGVICKNKEYVGENIGITQLVIEVKAPSSPLLRSKNGEGKNISSSMYGPYATCNICYDHRSPIRPSHSCQDGKYICDCQESNRFPPKHTKCTNSIVGRESVKEEFGPQGIGRFCAYGESKEACATSNAAQRIKGFWYSTLDIGKGKTWHTVKVLKKITKECHANSFLSAVENHNNDTATDCFRGCSRDNNSNDIDDQQVLNNHRNTSSVCWVQCFADATLGKNATTYKSYKGDGGMTRKELMEAWAQPFRSSDPNEGGCQDISLSTT